MPLLRQHPQRAALNAELHARPPERLLAPLVLSHIVMLCSEAERARSREHLAALLEQHGHAAPEPQALHLRADLGPVRLRWELHTEFVTWTFTRTRAAPPVAGHTALNAMAADWLQALPGQVLAALHLWVVSEGISPQRVLPECVRQLLQDDAMVASGVAHGEAQVYSDFLTHPDGFSRMVLVEHSLTAPRLGRLVQRLLEIETYRMAGLLALPAARGSAGTLAAAERELVALSEAIRSAARHDEPLLLDRLTRLACEVESQHAATHGRFSASAAYFELMDKRLADIDESELAGLQPVGKFLGRRISPARSTCAWAQRRQDALSERIVRVSELLRTRVEIEQQHDSQAILSAMAQRQDAQLKLQSTVEGLSVAAITYYIVGLVSYLAKGAHQVGWHVSPEAASAVAIPFVALGVALALRRIHQRIGTHA